MRSETESASGGQSEMTSIPAMEDKNREIMIEKSRLYLEKDNIIYVTAVGKVDFERARQYQEAIFTLANMAKGNVKALIDLDKAEKQSPEARKILQELVEYKKVEKLALFGIHPVARILASFGVGASKRKDVRFFKTKEEALSWLKES